MWAIFKTLLLVLLLGCLAWANSPAGSTTSFRVIQLPVEGLLLDTGGKYRPGDNPDWANPGLNDQDWQTMDPTQDIHDLPALWQSNIGWFRLQFSLDSSLRRESLALLVEQTGASEIFLNGRLIGKYGQISSQPEQVKAASPPFGEFISQQPDKERGQVLTVRFALQEWTGRLPAGS